MDSKLKLLKVCGVALVLYASAVSADTIYKQVDAEGHVTLTDQPSPSARVVTSNENSRPRAQAIHERDEAVPEAMPARPIADSLASRPAVELRALLQESPQSIRYSAARGQNEVERAVFSYTALVSSRSAQVDANEAARRARQERSKNTSAAVLVVTPVPRDYVPAATRSKATHLAAFRPEDFTWIYVLWAGTSFLLAAGLLYKGWQTLRLILAGAFPSRQMAVA